MSGVRPAPGLVSHVLKRFQLQTRHLQQGTRHTYLCSIIRLIPVLIACLVANPWSKGPIKHFNLINKQNEHYDAGRSC